MKIGSIQRRIVACEAMGFLFIILISWMNELASLSSRLFGAQYVSSWHESAFETAIVVVVAVPILYITQKLSKRLHYLEGFVKMCAWCRKVEDDGSWVPIEGYLQAHLATQTSHGVCPQCHAKLLEQVRERGASHHPG